MSALHNLLIHNRYTNRAVSMAFFSLAMLYLNTAFAEQKALDWIVAVVNDEVILASELTDRIDTIRSQNPTVQSPPASLRAQVLEQMIVEAIQLQIGNQTGIRLNDNELNTTLARIAAQNNLSLDAFREVIEQDGISYLSFREQIHREALINRIRQQHVGARITINEADINNFKTSAEGIKLLAPDYRLGHILVPNDQAHSEDSVSAAQLATKISEALNAGLAFTEVGTQFPLVGGGGDLGWRPTEQLPSLFADIVPQMNVGQASAPIEHTNGYHIVMLLEKRGIEKEWVPQTQVRHILIQTNAIRSNADAKQLAEDIRARILAGDAFADLAQTYSDDPVSAQKGGQLGWMNPGTTVPEFETATNNLTLNTISKPIKTEFGWHLIEVTDRRDFDMSTNNFNNRIRALIYERRFKEEVTSWLNEIRQEAFVEIKQT